MLSTPPAFVLSQDQTLRQRSSRFFDTSTDGGRGEDFALIWTRCPRGHRGSPSSPRRARRGWTAPGSNLAPMCWLIRSPDVPSTVALGQRTPGRARCACPVVTGFRALAFHTLLSFQGASWNRPCDSPGGSPRRSRRRSGGNLTLGLPGSSTERPIPWFLRGYPPFRSFVPFGRCLKRHRLRGSQTVETSGHPLVFPREPVAMPPQVHGADNSEPNPGIATRDLWRHLATSTSYRSAVLGPLAQDGHRSRRNSVPVAFGDLLSSVLAPSWRRRRGLGPRRTSLYLVRGER